MLWFNVVLLMRSAMAICMYSDAFGNNTGNYVTSSSRQSRLLYPDSLWYAAVKVSLWFPVSTDPLPSPPSSGLSRTPSSWSHFWTSLVACRFGRIQRDKWHLQSFVFCLQTAGSMMEPLLWPLTQLKKTSVITFSGTRPLLNISTRGDLSHSPYSSTDCQSFLVPFWKKLTYKSSFWSQWWWMGSASFSLLLPCR